MANEPWVIAPCGGVRLSKDSFEITYDEEDNKPLVEVKGSHKFTYKVKFEKRGNKIVSDHTHDEIVEAYKSGNKVIGEYDDLVFTLYSIEDGCQFTSADYYNLDKSLDFRALYISEANVITERTITPSATPEKFIKDIVKTGDDYIAYDNFGQQSDISPMSSYIKDVTSSGDKITFIFSDGHTEDVTIKSNAQSKIYKINCDKMYRDLDDRQKFLDAYTAHQRGEFTIVEISFSGYTGADEVVNRILWMPVAVDWTSAQSFSLKTIGIEIGEGRKRIGYVDMTVTWGYPSEYFNGKIYHYEAEDTMYIKSLTRWD